MPPGRNEPCPCGSGRKYEQCCLARDADGGDGSFAAASRALRDFAARAPEWEADAVPLMVGIDDGASHRPSAMIVTAGDFIVRADIRDRLGGEPDDVAAALERAVMAAAGDVGSLPERLTVRFPELIDPLRARLGPRGVDVGYADTTPNAERAARDMIENVAGHDVWPPVSMADSWGAWRLPPSLVRDLFAAAAAFWRRKPWKVMTDGQAPVATLPSGQRWAVCVLGNAGERYGIALYSDPLDVHRISGSAGPHDGLSLMRGRSISLGLDPVDELPAVMVREARAARWEVASPKAFPVLMTINTPAGGVTEAEIAELTAILRAVPGFADTHGKALKRENRTGVPCGVLEWCDRESGPVLRYSGEESAEGMRAAIEEASEVFARTLGELDDREFVVEDDPAGGFAWAAGDVGGDEDDPEVGIGDPFAIRDDPQLDLGDVFGPAAAGAGASGRTGRSGARRPRPSIDPSGPDPLSALLPHQLLTLFEADWLDPNGPVRLNRKLPRRRLDACRLLANARMLLDEMRERDGLPATAKGNLKVVVVRELAKRLRADADLVRFVAEQPRPLETDVWEMHWPRVLLELCGATTVRKGRIVLTKAGESLADSEDGELYARLFEANFRRMNLAYRSGIEMPDVQFQLGFTLYRLRNRPRDWRPADRIMDEAVLPIDGPMLGAEPFDHLEVLSFESQVLFPLAEFNLVEVAEAGGPGVEYDGPDRLYRTTPLLPQFLDFRL